MKNRWPWLIGGAAVLAGLAFFMFRGTSGGREIEYRYAPIQEGELVLSTSSVGLLVPLTRVDVKSKAGGKVVKLLVQEGSVVRQGDMVAFIDPADTQSTYEQAEADARAAGSRVNQAQTNATLEAKSAETRVLEAKLAVQQAQTRLERSIESARVQPTLTNTGITSAEANLQSQQESLRQLREVDFPQRRRDAQAQLRKAQTDVETAAAEFDRQVALLEKGYVSRASTERAKASLESARSSLESAEQRQSTLNNDFQSEVRSVEARIRQAQSELQRARAGTSDVDQANRAVREARQALEQSKIALRQAEDNRLNAQARRIDVVTSEASAVRSRVAMQNALVQLRSTKVEAPRAGIVTKKYLEEGTIIPPGTSTFSQGTSLIEISDTTRMFVECKVDEADIASVKPGQGTRIIVEAYPGYFFRGKVTRIFPAAETENNVTAIRVRVEIEEKSRAASKGRTLKPGMNSTVEFLQFEKPKTLLVPSAAIKREENGDTYVMVKGPDPKAPIKRPIKLGDAGNDGFEVLDGLKAGEEIVIAEIDLTAMRERQDKMLAATQGGGLGSQGPRGGPSQSRATTGGGAGGAGGGARPGGAR